MGKRMDKAENWVCRFSGKTYSAAVVILTGLLIYGMVLLTGCATAPPDKNIPQAIIDWSELNIYKVDTSKGKRRGGGTAWWVGPDHLITACHVVTGYETATVEDRLQRFVLPVKVISCDEDTDIAILEYSEPGSVPLKPTIFATAHTGERVYATGFSFGFIFNTQLGHWQYPRNGLNGISTETVSGDSGSPVLIYKNNVVYVVGMRVSVMSYTPNTYFGTAGSPQLMTYLANATTSKLIIEHIQEHTDGSP